MEMALKGGGDLLERIMAWGGLPYELARFYAAELMAGLSGHVVVSDFGLSEVFEIPGTFSPYSPDGTANRLPQEPYLTSGCCGTVSYMAPEIWQKEKYGFGIDFWALAITIYEMFTCLLSSLTATRRLRFIPALGALVSSRPVHSCGPDMSCASRLAWRDTNEGI
ncbi:kinase-like protein [Gyrodon lividus]|nr:kinase-like protein [Gyrodon lividus]